MPSTSATGCKSCKSYQGNRPTAHIHTHSPTYWRPVTKWTWRRSLHWIIHQRKSTQQLTTSSAAAGFKTENCLSLHMPFIPILPTSLLPYFGFLLLFLLYVYCWCLDIAPLPIFTTWLGSWHICTSTSLSIESSTCFLLYKCECVSFYVR